MTNTHRLFTIGYEKAAFAAFIATLQRAGIRRVIDVRDLPLSRRPGFSKRALAAGLAEQGIDYVHLRALGTPPAGREANRRKQWKLFWQIVDERLATTETELDLARAAELAVDKPSALLCYEADPAICHRCRVGTIMAARNHFTVDHLVVEPLDPGVTSSPASL